MDNFNDHQLENLLRLACEAEELERSVASPALRLVAGSARSANRKWLLPMAGLMAAAAAGVAVTTVVLPMIRPMNQPDPRLAVAPTGPKNIALLPKDQTPGTQYVKSGDFNNPLGRDSVSVTAEPGQEESSVVLAFFQGIDGRCSCMHIQKEEWDAAQLSDQGREQLLDLAFHSNCTQPSSKVLIVGISAPTNALPTSPEAAEALASRLADAFAAPRVDLVARAYEAMPQLPAGSAIVAESFGHSRGFLVEPAKWTSR